MSFRMKKEAAILLRKKYLRSETLTEKGLTQFFFRKSQCYLRDLELPKNWPGDKYIELGKWKF